MKITKGIFSLILGCSFFGVLINVQAKNKKRDKTPQFYDVFVAGQEPITGAKGEKYAKFREQNVIVTNSGKVVVICQGRNASRWCDRSGQDLVCKTSDNNGETWSATTLMVTHDLKSICPNASVYDAVHNRIITLYTLFQWPYTDAASRKTWEGPRRKQFMIYSDDEGKSWSTLEEITSMMKAEDAIVVFGSGEGIQLKNKRYKNRLVVPGGDFQVKTKRIYAFFSDDYGKTWKSGSAVPNPNEWLVPCENAITELSDGTLLMNERSTKGFRRKAVSVDGGETWSPFEEVKDLPSISCNASIITVPYKKGEVVLYAGPVGPNADCVDGNEYKGKKGVMRRQNGVVFASFDGGNTWPVRKLVAPEAFAYSSLVVLSDGSIGLFYEAEGHKNIKMAKFSLKCLLKKK